MTSTGVLLPLENNMTGFEKPNITLNLTGELLLKMQKTQQLTSILTVLGIAIIIIALSVYFILK